MSAEFTSAVVSSTGKTRFRAALERARDGGAPRVGQWMEFPGYTLARTVAGLGSDWVLVDCEHAGASPIVRIPAGEAWMMKRALDAGAHGIMIPMRETKEQAEAIVNGMKYPSAEWPNGIRGAGAMFAPAYFQQNGQDYLRHANDNIVVIVQIESRKAVENCEEISKTPGIDALFIGPNDLAASMGYFAFDHPKIEEVQQATARVLKASKDAEKFAGHFALSADIAAKRSKQGFHFMNCDADISAITVWMSTEMARMKTLMKK